jgi:hypothetical protein
VRTISRKGPVPQPGWMQSRPTSVITWRDSSMEKEASMFRSVESAIEDCRFASRCRSTSRRSVRKLPSFCDRSSGWERCEVAATVSSTSKTKPADLEARVFPFFDRFALRCPKLNDLAVFRQITALVRSGRQLTPRGIGDILALRGPMNRGGKRRRSDEEIIEALRSWESSEAIRRAPALKRRDEDMVHAP